MARTSGEGPERAGSAPRHPRHKSQNHRERTLGGVPHGEIRTLVATDIAPAASMSRHQPCGEFRPAQHPETYVHTHRPTRAPAPKGRDLAGPGAEEMAICVISNGLIKSRCRVKTAGRRAATATPARQAPTRTGVAALRRAPHNVRGMRPLQVEKGLAARRRQVVTMARRRRTGRVARSSQAAIAKASRASPSCIAKAGRNRTQPQQRRSTSRRSIWRNNAKEELIQFEDW